MDRKGLLSVLLVTSGFSLLVFGIFGENMVLANENDDKLKGQHANIIDRLDIPVSQFASNKLGVEANNDLRQVWKFEILPPNTNEIIIRTFCPEGFVPISPVFFIFDQEIALKGWIVTNNGSLATSFANHSDSATSIVNGAMCLRT
jgi:hypothetical protein